MGTKARYVGGVQTFFDDVSFENVFKMSPFQYRDDFIGPGSTVIPAAGSAESGVDWVKKIVGTGPPTVAEVANAIGGQVACTLTSTSEKQDAALYWGDKKAIDVTKGVVFECRVNLAVLPSAAGVQAVFGLASDWIDGPDNNTCYLQVGATANGVLNVRSFDGTTTKSVAAGVTVINTDFVTLRIDCTDVTDVKMYINGAQVTATGLINFAATGTLAVLQPYFGMYKPSGVGVGTLKVDYAKIWMNRS